MWCLSKAIFEFFQIQNKRPPKTKARKYTRKRPEMDVNMRKREAGEDLKDDRQVKGLKSQAIVVAFDTLTLQEKRDLMPELLKMARVVNGYSLNHISPDFVRWMCSGEKKLWEQDELEKYWELYNFLYRRVGGGKITGGEHYNQWFLVWSPHQEDTQYEGIDWFEDQRAYEKGTKTVKKITRKQFFDILLKEFLPEHLDIVFSDTEVKFIDYASKNDEKSFNIWDLEEHLDLGAGYYRDVVPDPRL
jgi:hypothetical protein